MNGVILQQSRTARTKRGLRLDRSQERLQKSLLHLHAAMELEEVAKAVFEVMNTAVPNRYVGVYFQVVEFEKPLIVRVSPDFGYNPAQWKRFFEINPVGAFWAAHPGMKIFRRSDAFGEDEWRAMDFYREFAEPKGWYHAANLGFWKGGRLLGGVCALRSLAQGDFSDAEMKRLLGLHSYLDAAMQRLDRLHAERNARAAAEQLLQRLPLPTVLLDWDLRVIHSNAAACDSCALWNFGPEQARAIKGRDQFHVPAVVLEKCRELKAQWHDKMIERYTLDSPTGHPLCHPARPELRANIHLVQRSTGSITKPVFRVDFEQAPGANAETGSGTSAERGLALSARLTRRERELVELLCQGAANKDIAGRLSLSVGTIKKELNTLYRKLEVNSRSQLMALMR
ncbi:MAG TPA: helix-turn-helix transcriptional regulator [Haliangiales bacterium]|nr:helix-turn-helix transcriptional regulator [Haliangiales bacterium]